MSIFKKKVNESLMNESFMVAEDFAMYKKGRMVDISLYDTELKITSKNDVVTLPYSKITNVVYDLQTSIVEKDKSSIGRAIIGGALFGATGAVVGAVSGTGKKEKQINNFVFIISYKNSEQTESFIAFQDVRLWTGRKLSNKLKELCQIADTSVSNDITL